MTTYYTQVPTLEMRVAASPLIVIGVVGKVVGSQVDYYDHEPFVRSTFEVTVHKVLKGVLEQQIIRVEVMGGESDKAATPQRVPMPLGASLVLMLVPQGDDYEFVPYFGSAFSINAEGEIALGPQAIATLSSKMTPITSENITLDTLRMFIETVSEIEAAERKAAESVMTGQALPPILEIPQGLNGGGEPSEPQADEQHKSAN